MNAQNSRNFRVSVQNQTVSPFPTRLIFLINESSDARIGEIVEICLERIAGWNVVSSFAACENSVASLRMQPDAILFNAQLSCMHDLSIVQKQVIQSLKQHPLTQSSPILLMIDTADWLTAQQLQSLDVSGAIAKPFDPILLSTQMSHLLGWNVA